MRLSQLGRVLALACMAFATSCAAPDFVAPVGPDDVAVANGVVLEIADGDTLRIDLASGPELVRLLGIDTPETVDPNRPAQCYGAQASAYLHAALPPGTAVRVVRDQQSRDRFGRLLAYVQRASDGAFINLEILAGGFGETLSIAPNTTYREVFRSARDAAAADGRGLWGSCDGPDQPLAG